VVRLEWPSWVGVVVHDLAKQRRFYREVLGFSEVKAGSDSVHFDLGDGNLLELVE
jgi:catechol 2,3-dioxygenase-like lactoylglutathione lyase family enzyme